jgi:hypothetical protein
VSKMLSPLLAQRQRLSQPIRSIAGLACADVGLDWDWELEVAGSGSDHPSYSTRTVLLYSLEEGVLARVGACIKRFAPQATVHLCSAKVGSSALKQQANRADLVVIATRRAAHAATGFITANATHATIVYPDGSGSASMVRAVEQGMSLVGD